jgi:D-lactate dehydrogenase
MDVAVFSTRRYERRFLEAASEGTGHQFRFLEARLSRDTADLAAGSDAICAFVNDDVDADVIGRLAAVRVRLIALRSAGFNHVDLAAAHRHGILVARVPAYSPHAVAEHTVALILALNRRIHRAYNRIREGNFALEGLLGFDLFGKTVGIIGTGYIGACVARIMVGFGCTVLGHDPKPDPACQALGVHYTTVAELLAASDIVTLHCPLTPDTHHLIDAEAIGGMRRGVMLINTSRGAVVDTKSVIDGLKTGVIGSLGLDVYEEEENLFFEDQSDRFIPDDIFARLLTFPNVLITGHQAFFTEEALREIARTTVANLTSYEQTGRPVHVVDAGRRAEHHGS